MITMADINTIVNQGLMLVIKMSLPVLLTSMIVGLIISIFQTVTSIQEQTLTFVPKVICVFLMIMLTIYSPGCRLHLTVLIKSQSLAITEQEKQRY